MELDKQNIYIYIDDASVFHEKHEKFYYLGLFFASKEEKNNAINLYTNWENYIRCLKKAPSGFNYRRFYCKSQKELKGANLKFLEKIWFLNLIKMNWIFTYWISNISKIYKYQNIQKQKKFLLNKYFLKDDKTKFEKWGNNQDIATYKQYSIKRIVKKGIQKLIQNQKISIFKPTNIYIFIDEQNQKIGNGYYKNLDLWIKNELLGIVNSSFNKPIFINKNINVYTKYEDSKNSPLIRAADILVNSLFKLTKKQKITTRETMFENNFQINFLN